MNSQDLGKTALYNYLTIKAVNGSSGNVDDYFRLSEESYIVFVALLEKFIHGYTLQVTLSK